MRSIALINHQGLKVKSGIQLQSPSPPIGLAYLSAYIKQKGLECECIDACGESLSQIAPYKGSDNILIQGLSNDQVLDRLSTDTKIVGLTCLFTQSQPLVSDLAIAIKKRYPHIFIVTGGEHPTAIPEDVLDNENFDAIVYGEGEESFYELCQKVLAGEDWTGIEGIIYQNQNGLMVKNLPRKRISEIDGFPYPDWDSWSIKNYINWAQVTGITLGRSMPILGSRGCPYACTFCSNESMWTRRYVMRDGKDIVDEMQLMAKKYNVNGFTFMDSTFIVNKKKTIDFARELINRNLKINYQIPAGTRCEAFDADLLELLEKSGLKNFALAPESGSEEILKTINKQIKIPKFLEVVKMIVKTKMTFGVFFVIGFPEDTKESLKKTLSLVRKLASIGVDDITVSKFTPYPGSPYYKQLAQKQKVRTSFNNTAKMINFFDSNGQSYCDELSEKELNRWMIWCFFNFYFISIARRPWRLLFNLFDFVTTGRENTRYMRLFSELLFVRGKWKKHQKAST